MPDCCTSQEPVYTYSISGLTVASQIPLPSATLGAGSSEKPADVLIQWSKIPHHLPGATKSGEDWETAGTSFLFRVPEVARFLVQQGSSIAIEPEDGHDPGELALYTLGTCFAILLQQRGAIVLHASAIAVDSKAILFCGPSGAGKSTTAAIFCQFGYPLLNEDVCTIVQTEAQEYRALPDSRKLKLWGNALKRLSFVEGNSSAVSGKIDKYFVTPPTIDNGSGKPIGAIYLLEDADPGEPVTISRLNSLEATIRLKRNAYRPLLLKIMNQEEEYFRACLGMQKNADVFRLKRPRDFELRQQLIEAMQEHWKTIGLRDPLSANEEQVLCEATNWK